MAFIAHSYNNANNSQRSHGNQLIEGLLKDNPNKVFDIIVDVGSGSGNVTKQLCNRIPHKRIVALDINRDMTEFAKQNHSSNTIEYITEDISKPWDQLNTTLKELEGKVSLIFSNRVLHWVEDKETAAKNMSKLLRTDGDILVNISAIQDLSQHLSQEFNENFVKIPSIDEQFEIWRNLLVNNGIELSFTDNYYEQTYYDRNAFAAIWPAIPQLYRIYVKTKDPEIRERVINDSKFKEVVYDSTFCWKTEFRPNSYQEFMNSNADGKELPYAQFRYIGKKTFEK